MAIVDAGTFMPQGQTKSIPPADLKNTGENHFGGHLEKALQTHTDTPASKKDASEDQNPHRPPDSLHASPTQSDFDQEPHDNAYDDTDHATKSLQSDKHHKKQNNNTPPDAPSVGSGHGEKQSRTQDKKVSDPIKPNLDHKVLTDSRSDTQTKIKRNEKPDIAHLETSGLNSSSPNTTTTSEKKKQIAQNKQDALSTQVRKHTVKPEATGSATGQTQTSNLYPTPHLSAPSKVGTTPTKQTIHQTETQTDKSTNRPVTGTQQDTTQTETKKTVSIKEKETASDTGSGDQKVQHKKDPVAMILDSASTDKAPANKKTKMGGQTPFGDSPEGKKTPVVSTPVSGQAKKQSSETETPSKPDSPLTRSDVNISKGPEKKGHATHKSLEDKMTHAQWLEKKQNAKAVAKDDAKVDAASREKITRDPNKSKAFIERLLGKQPNESKQGRILTSASKGHDQTASITAHTGHTSSHTSVPPTDGGQPPAQPDTAHKTLAQLTSSSSNSGTHPQTPTPQGQASPFQQALDQPLETTKTQQPQTSQKSSQHKATEQVALSIKRGLTSGKDQISIRLDPPEMGRVKVKLTLSADGNVSTKIVANNPETLEMLKRDSRELERALKDAGLEANQQDMEFELEDETSGKQAHTAQDQKNTQARRRKQSDDPAQTELDPESDDASEPDPDDPTETLHTSDHVLNILA